MRPRLILPSLLLLCTAGAAAAQSVGGIGSAGAASGSLSGMGAGTSASSGPLLGRPPQALGTTSSLGQRIDRAAGLGTSRASGGISLPGTIRPEGRSGTSIGNSVFSASPGINTAGQPAGTPFGSNVGGNANPIPN